VTWLKKSLPALSATQNRLCDVEMCLLFNLADSVTPPWCVG
jgi:hypothetical protein